MDPKYIHGNVLTWSLTEFMAPTISIVMSPRCTMLFHMYCNCLLLKDNGRVDMYNEDEIPHLKLDIL